MLLIHRSILWELCRTTLLTAGVLVTVIAFGAAIRPLSQNLLGPRELAVFVLLACVPMLQYALPFAAAFATTTVYMRLAGDREVQAMAAAGWSLGRILRPVWMLGAVLLVVLLGLVHFVAPTFWVSMQNLIGRDAARLLVASVQQGRALEVGAVEIYADEAYLSPDPPPSGARDRLYLVGVAAIEMDRQRSAPATEFTAEHAVVDIHQGEDGPILKMALVNATLQRAGDAAVAVLPQAMPEAIDLGGQRRGGAKGLTLPQLIEARRSPDGIRQIRDAADPLRRLLRLEAIHAAVAAGLASPEGALLRGPADGTRVRIEHAALRRGRLEPADAATPIRISELRDGRTVREAVAGELTLVIEADGDGAAAFELIAPSGLEAIERSGPREAAGRWPQRIAGLAMAEADGVPPVAGSAASLIEEGRRRAAEAPTPESPMPAAWPGETAAAADRLEASLARFDLDLVARGNQRFAQAFTGLLLPLLAGVLAVRSRSTLVLVVFLLAFLPAIGLMLCISSGEQMARWDRPQAGLALIWGSEAAMAIAVAWGWWRASRN